jgi:hypothetical protein
MLDNSAPNVLHASIHFNTSSAICSALLTIGIHGYLANKFSTHFKAALYLVE